MGYRLGSVDPVRHLGKVTQAQISKEKTILVGGHGQTKQRFDAEFSPIDARVHYLTGLVEAEDLLLGEEEQEEIMARIQKLKAGLVFL